MYSTNRRTESCDAEPFVAADGPPAPCQRGRKLGPPQNNTFGIYGCAMSVGKRVTDSFEKMKRGDAEGALFAICAAIEETARRESLPKGRRGFKRFIADNIHIISGIGIGHPIAGLSIGYAHPDLPRSSDGNARIEDIVYHLIRCGLYHSAMLPATVCLTENKIGSDKDILLLVLIYVAVIGSYMSLGYALSRKWNIDLARYIAIAKALRLNTEIEEEAQKENQEEDRKGQTVFWMTAGFNTLFGLIAIGNLLYAIAS